MKFAATKYLFHNIQTNDSLFVIHFENIHYFNTENMGSKSKNIKKPTGILSAHVFSLNKIKIVILTILEMKTSKLHHIHNFQFEFEANIFHTDGIRNL